MNILYYYSKLNIGGAERSTVRLLNKMVERGCNVSLLLRWNNGTLEDELDQRIQLIHLKQGDPEQDGFLAQIYKVIKMYICLKKLNKKKYDLVISGLFGYNPSILFKHIKAEKYFQMLRNDVEKTGKYGKTDSYMKKYGEKFDAYIGVSEFTTDSFKKCYPNLSKKAYTIYNILPEIDPYEKRICPPELVTSKKNCIKILTICRMADQAKGLFRMEKVCKRLYELYPGQFKWFVVGNGPDKAKLKLKIEEDQLDEVMVLCHETTDPFIYYAYCDLVAVLSYYEGLCGVVNEAKLMLKPVIATEFSGIHEQIEDGFNGVIVENKEESIFEGFKYIFTHKELLKNMSINGMSQKLLDNDNKVNEFIRLYNINLESNNE